MEPLERLEKDYLIAREKGARPELLSKMEEQIGKLSLRNIPEPEIIEPEEVYFPSDDIDDQFTQKEIEFVSNSIDQTRQEDDYDNNFEL